MPDTSRTASPASAASISGPPKEKAAHHLACVVLAAGLGTRMKSARPKVLHEAAGRSLLGHVLRAAESLNPDRIIVVTGPEMGDVAAAAAPHPTVVQTDRLGTGDAVKAALPELEDFAGTVLVLFGDSPLITGETLRRMARCFAEPPAPGSPPPSVAVMAVDLDDPGAYGRVIVDSDGDVARIVEAADADEAELAVTLCNSGIMAFAAASLPERLQALTNNNAKGEYYLTDLIAMARAAGERCAVIEGSVEEFLGVNSRADLAEVEAILQARLREAALAAGVTLQDPTSVYLSADAVLASDVTIEPHVYIGPGVTIGSGSLIRAFSHLEGVTIGENVRVGPFARLRPGAELEESVQIGNFVEVKNSRLGSGAKVNHLTYLGDATVGEGANIGAGTITCNYDGFLKYRTEIGPGAFIGSNSSLVAPLRIGARANVAAGSTITGDVPDDSLGIARGRQEVKEGWTKSYRQELFAIKTEKKKKKS